MFPGMLLFEWRYHTRRLSFALVAVVLCGMAFMLVKTGYGANSAYVNSPYAIMQSFGLLSLWTLFSQTIFCVHGALRDDEFGMRELILSRPVGRFRYLASRYLGVVGAGVSAMFLATVVMMLVPFVVPFDAGQLGAPQPRAYVWALVTVIIPDIILVSALLFAVAAFARSTLATYVGAIALFGLYTAVAVLTDSPLMAGSAPSTPAKLALAAILDPFGLSAFFEQTRYWTPAERNVRMVTLSGNFLLNRLLWTTVAAAVLAATYRFVSLGATLHADVGRNRAHEDRASSGGNINRANRRLARTGGNGTASSASPGLPGDIAPSASYAPVTPTAGTPALFWSALWSTTRLELRQVFNAWIFRALMLLWLVIFGVEVTQELGSGEYGTRLLATSGLMIGRLADPLRLIGTLCLMYFSAEVVWRERQLHVDAVIDATPASNGVFFLAKLITLCALPVIMTAIGIGAGIALQLIAHGAAVQPMVFAAEFWFTAYPMVLFGIAAMVLQVLTGNRWTGMVAAFVVAIFAVSGAFAGVEHPMLRYGAAPPVLYSDLDGFGPAVASFNAFMGYWTTGALLLMVVSWAAWRRGYDAGVRRRIARVWRTPRLRLMMLLTGAAFSLAAMLLFRETNVAHAWVNSASAQTWQVDYERAYRRYAAMPQPSVVAIDVAVDFSPAHRRAAVHGTLTLRNRTLRAIDTILLNTRAGALAPAITIDGDSATAIDARFNTRRFALAKRLQPGDSATLRYALTLDRGGIRAADFDRDIAGNGSYLSAWDAMPSLGYRSGFEIDNEADRLRYGLGTSSAGLAPLDSLERLTREAHRAGNANAWSTLHATISTDGDQQPWSSGRLVRAWTDGDRRYAEYRMDSLVPARFAFGSGRYAVRRVQHGTVAVELWYHPGHPQNVERMLTATTRALDVLGARFGRYRHETLRMIEVPAGWPFAGFAMSGTLLFTENRGMLSDPRSEDVDLVTRRVAHEVSHQWWGYEVDPVNVVGATTIVESLAKYSEQLVVASFHGDSVLPAMLAFDHDRYLRGRASDAAHEPTLLTTRDEGYMYYGKGALAMHALHDALGDSTVAEVLRALIAQERGPFGAATATQLYHMLRAAATTDDNRALVDEWFTERVLYDMRADTATAVPTGSGYRVNAGFSMLRASTINGQEVVQPANATTVDVVVYGAEDSKLYAGKADVVNGRVTLNVPVSAAPRAVEIDHMVRRIDRERSDNRKSVVIRPR